MGRKLDALLRRKFKTGKFKTAVNLAVSRLAVLKNHRQARLAVARSDVTQLLHLNHHEHALLRVDQVMKEQNMLDVFVMIDGYCHLLLQRINLIEQEKDCPDELKEAVSSLLYAAPRCGEFPEIQEIRAIFTARYGKEFAYGAIELRNNCGVNPKMIQKLSPRQSSLESRMKILTEMATENGVILQLEDLSPVINKIEQKQNQQKPETDSTIENDPTVLPEVLEVLSFSESIKGKKKYRDVADAAQAAFESAAYAAAAARAAVELSRSGSFGSGNPDSPNSRPRKILDSKPMKSRLLTEIEKTDKYESESEREYKVTDVENEGEKLRNNAKNIVFDESDDEIEEHMVFTDFSSSRNYNEGFSAKKGMYPNEIFDSSKDDGILEAHNESLYGEGRNMDLKKKPVSVRTRRVYGR